MKINNLNLILDTDSICLSLSRPSLDECVLPECRDAWNVLKPKWFVSFHCENTEKNCPDCAAQAREPGLLKIEVANAPNIAFIGLSAKCYFLGQENRFKRLKFSVYLEITFKFQGIKRGTIFR